MRETARRFLQCATVPLVMVVAGCASGGAAGGAEAAATPTDGFTVTVQNDVSAATELTVFIEPVGGVRQSLGVVEAGEIKSFVHSGGNGFYVLIAQRPTGSDRRSDRFSINGPSVVTWNLTTGRVLVSRR